MKKLKLAEGWRKLIKQNVDNDNIFPITTKTGLTVDDMAEYLMNIWYTPRERRNIVLGVNCKTYGFVTRTITNLNLCNDKQCLSCTRMKGLLKEELNTYEK